MTNSLPRLFWDTNVSTTTTNNNRLTNKNPQTDFFDDSGEFGAMELNINNKFAQKSLSGGADCNNGVFGDPVPGARASCLLNLSAWLFIFSIYTFIS